MQARGFEADIVARVKIQVRFLYLIVTFSSKDFKMQIMTPTNLSDPSTLQEGNENPNVIKDS